MKLILKLFSYLSLALTIIPAVLVFNKNMSIDTYKHLILIGSLAWFVSAPFWMFQNHENQQQ